LLDKSDILWVPFTQSLQELILKLKYPEHMDPHRDNFVSITKAHKERLNRRHSWDRSQNSLYLVEGIYNRNYPPQDCLQASGGTWVERGERGCSFHLGSFPIQPT